MPPRSSDYVENHRETNSWYGNLVLADAAPAAAAPPPNRVWGGGPRAPAATANLENTTLPGGAAAANDPEGGAASPPRARVPVQAAETPAIVVEPTRTLLWRPPDAAPTAGGLPETETNLAALAASVTMDEADLQQQQQQDGLNASAPAAAPLALVSPLLPRPPPAIQRRAYNHPTTTTNAFAFPGMPQQPPPPLLQFHPIATTLDDLKRAAEHCDLADLIDATCLHGATATPRLACLGLQLLAERASTASSDLRAVFSVRIVRQLLQLLWQPLDWLTQEWAAHVLQRLSTDDLMDQRLLVDVARSNNHHEPNLLTVLAQVLRGDGGEQRRNFAPPCDAPLPTSVTPIGVVSSVTGSPRPAHHHEAPASTATTTTPLSHHLSANDQPQPAAEDSWPVGTPATQSFTLTPAALPPFPMLGGGAKATTMSPVISTLSPRFNNHNNTAHGMMVTQQTRVHAAITLMNLSCGSGSPANVEVHSNKALIASNTALLLAIRDVLWEAPPPLDEHRGVWNLLRLKLVIGVKNLATLPEEACGGNLLRCPCLVRGLGHLILTETTASLQAAPAVTSAITVHAIQAVSNLSAAKEFKSHIYHTPGLVQSLMIVLTRDTKPDDDSATREARVRALSVLANLAISYDNKLSMYHYPGLLGAVCNVVTTSMKVEARPDKAENNPGAVVALRRRLLPKACSILWSLAAEKENQVPLVQSGLNVPQMLIQVATANHDDEDSCCCCLARPKCLAALTLLAESPANAMPLLQAGILCPLLACLQQGLTTEKRGLDNHTCVSWSVSCLMNLAQVDTAIPLLLEAGVVELLAPFVLATASTTNDSSNNDYQRLKAAMAVTLCCRLPKGSDGRSSSAALAAEGCMDRHYNVLRKVETYIPEMIELLDNTLSGQGGPGYKYGVFTLSSCVACMASLASGPDFWREQLLQQQASTRSQLLWSSLLRVLLEFGEGGPGSIVGGGPDDVMSARWAMQALHSMTGYLRDMSDDKSKVLQLPVGGTNAAAFTEALQRALHRAHQRFCASSALVQTAVHNQQTTAAMVESMSEPEKGAVLGAGMAVRTLQLLLGSRRHHVVPNPVVAAETRGDEEDAKPRSCRTVHGGTKRPACSLSIAEPQQASSSSFDLDHANSHDNDNVGSRDGEYVLWSPVSVVAAAGTLEDPQRANKRTKRAPFLPPKTAQSPPPP